LRVFELFDAGEMPIGQDGVGERPQVFGGLQFRGIRGQEEQVNVIGDAEVHARVPSSPIQHEDDLLVGAGANLAGKCPSSTSKSRILTAVARWTSVRPEAGCTKPSR
jgi:hypothetical protein